MDQPPLDNRSEFAAHPQMLLDRDGEKLLVVVKASFELPRGATELQIAPEDRNRGVRLADIPWGEPDVSSIAYPADLCLRKPGTDVIVVGSAHAPGGEPKTQFDVRVTVGSLAKSLAVFGSRVWLNNGEGISAPQPVDKVDLRYEYAWGGFDDTDPENPVEEARNPIGRGKVLDSSSLSDAAAPQIEDPGALIMMAGDAPAPAGVGAVGRHWEPRRRYAGTYDDVWSETRSPLPPSDLDDRFNICASPGLHTAEPIVGGEPVMLWNLLPGGGAVNFDLPLIPIEIEFRVKGRDTVTMRPHIDTVLIDVLETSDEKPPAVELVWRAYVKAPRKMNDARIIVRDLGVPS